MLITSLAFSQQEASVWYFGQNAGLKFDDSGNVTTLIGVVVTDISTNSQFSWSAEKAKEQGFNLSGSLGKEETGSGSAGAHSSDSSKAGYGNSNGINSNFKVTGYLYNSIIEYRYRASYEAEGWTDWGDKSVIIKIQANANFKTLNKL